MREIEIEEARERGETMIACCDDSGSLYLCRGRACGGAVAVAAAAGNPTSKPTTLLILYILLSEKY